MARREVVITGLGIVSPIGTGVERFWSAALSGISGVGLATRFSCDSLPPPCRVVAEVRDFQADMWLPTVALRRAGRFSQFAVAAARMALEDSRVLEAQVRNERVQVSVGTSMSGVVDIHEHSFSAFMRGEEVVPWTVLEFPAHAATSHIAITAHARGRAMSVATACAAGLDAIALGAERIACGEATVVVAGGCETPLSAYSLQAFYNVGVLAKWSGPPEAACRPFERHRTGLVLGEGAAMVVLEDAEHARSRRAKVYARFLGSDSAAEGEHLRKVDLSGGVIADVFGSALRRSGLRPDDIDYIAAHGNGMIDYDLAETAGIKRALGRHAYNVPISSLKAMCGQSLAASGAMQVVAACLSLRDQRVPPTINFQERDPECDLDYVPNRSRAARIRNVLVHAHSMGGSHTAVVLGATGE
ncbi:MAG TPA: beta-ketoacyl-[acyl-carrier-protein] synthase family protein [Gemmatimonadales bacterium]|nr:beta-ketoacyl-[acyl-carrier-protein] synthase family protein [Gemmatimonadales bacterium]